jgi:peptide/nickel transport system substrate-binding protein
MMKRLLAVTAVFAVLAAACTGGGGDGASPTGGTGGTQAGQILTVGLFQEPDNLNPFLAVQTASQVVRELTLEGLVDADAEGNYVPQLAAEVPSVENGGITNDGKTITYTLQDGVTWSDGDPFTSADVLFTWQAVMDPDNAVNTQTGYDQIASIDTPDETTVVINFKQLYAPALSLFSIPDAVLPAHVLEGQAMGNADFNRTPEGTGAFVVTEWKSGDSIVLDRNPNYREEGQPSIDRVVFKIIPSREVGVAQIRAGEIDVLWNLAESDIPTFQDMPGVSIQTVPSPNVEYLGLNLADGTDPGTPHPILGDPLVREAIATAIDRQPIVEQLLYGMTEVATAPINLGWAAPQGLSFPAYDPAKAQSLLEQAGWADANGDGIREKDGTEMSLDITAPAGDQLRELTEQILQEQLKAVGIQLNIKNKPAATLFGTWEENGTLKKGTYDIVLDTWGPDLDPDAFMSLLFSSDQIPTAQNNGEGFNFLRLQDPKLDQAILKARSTLDLAERQQWYKVASEQILSSIAYLPLYQRAEINAFGSRVTGNSPNPWDGLTWNIAGWQLQS